MAPMRTVNAREANQQFSALLGQVERGEEVLITKHGRAVAVMTPPRPPQMSKERNRAILAALELTKKGVAWGTRPPATPTTRYRAE